MDSNVIKRRKGKGWGMLDRCETFNAYKKEWKCENHYKRGQSPPLKDLIPLMQLNCT